MRITCPNCGAQYEVDDALIPESGRDVQCSNCGKGWFQARHAEPADDAQMPSDDAAPETDVVEAAQAEDKAPEAETVEAQAADDEAGEAEAASVSDVTAEPQEEPEAAAEDTAPTGAEDDDLREPAADEEEDEDEPVAAPPAAVEPRKPDESVLSVLREEAEREIAQRRQDAGGIESQPDLGLSEPPQRRTGPSDAEIATGAAVAASARRDLLPDIDEINSTLRPDTERAAADSTDFDATTGGERRRGFRTGFGLMLLLAAVLIGLYLAAGALAAAVPALEPLLIAYVEAANAFRAWIDGLLASGVDAMSG